MAICSFYIKTNIVIPTIQDSLRSEGNDFIREGEEDLRQDRKHQRGRTNS